MPPMARRAVLLKWADLIEAEIPAITVLGVRDNGTEIGMAEKAEAGSAIRTIRYYAEAIDKIYGEVAPTPDSHLGLILREPVGVVAAIVLELSADDRRLETGAGAGGRKFGCHQAGGNGLSEPAAHCPAGA